MHIIMLMIMLIVYIIPIFITSIKRLPLSLMKRQEYQGILIKGLYPFLSSVPALLV